MASTEDRTARIEVAMQTAYARWELGQAPSPSAGDLVAIAVAVIGDDTDPLDHGAELQAQEDLYVLQCDGLTIREQAEFLADALFECR